MSRADSTVSILDRAMSPEMAVARLAELGLHISERSLRKKARELGACRVFGKAMILLPEHLEILLESPCPSKSTIATASGGIGVRLPDDGYTQALARLTKKQQSVSRTEPKPENSNVTLMARRRS